ncbi:type II toxin-antitoxin system Phd/YefM family antitoxin [Candidatus Oscillochloris fontis]|uniref:type II toxin-antitoxin system Phd/YefM family antitoxin n=1 Tax=Candidatus Oscillochloris fontis TaxID=2496868 RepID=UPI00101CE69F|nr:type II toxin-antitoxin system Phd/YefM family antitoxin [Candidatus Oscillochloris fontis]
MTSRTTLNLDVDLQRGVVPISKAASSLASLIKRANSTGRPVIVTQKGYPSGVLLPIELFTLLKELADEHALTPDEVSSDADESSSESSPVEEEPTSKPRRNSGRRRNAKINEE